MNHPNQNGAAPETPIQMTGAQMIWEAMVREGVRTVFGHPGGAILPAYDALTQYELDGKIHHVLVRHEQCAGHMADGYARVTGRVGVCVATSGPGATNLVTGLATAQMDCGRYRPGANQFVGNRRLSGIGRGGRDAASL